MMQHTDTDIDLTLDDAELVYETTGWSRLVHGSSLAAGVAALAAVPADLLGKQDIFAGLVVAFVAALILAGFALVMEYRADHRAPEIGGHSA